MEMQPAASEQAGEDSLFRSAERWERSFGQRQKDRFPLLSEISSCAGRQLILTDTTSGTLLNYKIIKKEKP